MKRLLRGYGIPTSKNSRDDTAGSWPRECEGTGLAGVLTAQTQDAGNSKATGYKDECYISFTCLLSHTGRSFKTGCIVWLFAGIQSPGPDRQTSRKRIKQDYTRDWTIVPVGCAALALPSDKQRKCKKINHGNRKYEFPAVLGQ